MTKGIVLLAVLVATPAVGASAQETPRQGADRAASPGQQTRILQLQQMEQALEEAVVRGARVVEQQLPAVLPGMVLFAGPIQARGFILDDYGVFFDVEYPVVRRSLWWSMNMLDQMEGGMAATFEELRRRMDAMPEGPGQLEFEHVLSELEARFRPPVSQPVSPDAAGGVPPARSLARVDPGTAYLNALKAELAGVLIAHGRSTGVADGEWISIAARDARGRVDPRRVPGARTTLVLRVQGRDLDAIEAGRLSAEDVEALIEIR